MRAEALTPIDEVSPRRGQGGPDLALLTDGLRGEQGITNEVAYRYCAKLRRRFILADTSGGVKYTRNLVTGATTADLAVNLANAGKGVAARPMRLCMITGLPRYPHVVELAANKTDDVGYQESTFTVIGSEFTERAESGFADIVAIPTSALVSSM